MSVKKRQNILPVLFAVAVCFAAVLLSANTMEAAVRETDVSTPSEGNVLVQVPGEYEKAEIATILKQVNGYRLEACQNGYPDPDDPSEKLTMADYSEVKWSGDLSGSHRHAQPREPFFRGISARMGRAASQYLTMTFTVVQRHWPGTTEA